MDILLYINVHPKKATDDMHVKVFRGMYTDIIFKCILKKELMDREMPRWIYVKIKYSNYINGKI